MPDTDKFSEPRGLRRRADTQRMLLTALFARIDSSAIAVAMGMVVALILFLATAILLLKGAPAGVPIGPNLLALETFLPGYDVTWTGAMLGAVYGFPVGAVVGYMLSVLWNFAHLIVIGIAVVRGNWLVN